MNRSAVLVLILTYSFATGNASGFECKVCHSKNPKMVAMHQALQGQNCFDCHKIGERLMGKGFPKDHAGLMARRSSDQACVPCHVQVLSGASQR